jgi:WW domain-containing oxidoreductase
LNAGVFGLPFTLSEDGYEAIFQSNYLGHFYLTQLLSPVLKASAPSRVIALTSESHRSAFEPSDITQSLITFHLSFRFTDLSESTICENILSPPEEVFRPIYSYNQAKLCNILHIQELHRRLAACGVMCHAVHPGNIVSTGLSRHWWFYRLLFMAVRPFAKSQVGILDDICIFLYPT